MWPKSKLPSGGPVIYSGLENTIQNLTALYRIPLRPVQDPHSVPYSFAIQKDIYFVQVPTANNI